VLQLKAIGIEDVLHFDFLSPPPVPSMLFALEVLFSLGALNDKCQLTR
jgi:HrpA-like RNA helicase